jgi:hypothetical protein
MLPAAKLECQRNVIVGRGHEQLALDGRFFYRCEFICEGALLTGQSAKHNFAAAMSLSLSLSSLSFSPAAMPTMQANAAPLSAQTLGRAHSTRKLRRTERSPAARKNSERSDAVVR